MDLSNLNLQQMAESGYQMTVVHPVTGDELDGVITVRGQESKVVRAFERRKVTELQKKQTKNKEYLPSPQEIEDWNVESAITRVISWKNIQINGEDVPFTKENADKVFREHDWLITQVLEASRTLTNFQ